MLRTLVVRLDALVRRREIPVARIASWLVVGPALPSRDYRALVRRGITHVVDLRAEEMDDERSLGALGIRHLYVPVPDRSIPTDEQFDLLERWVNEAETAGGVVYLHCQAGLQRTTVVAAALLVRRGMTAADAFRALQIARPGANPTEAQHAWFRRVRAEAPPQRPSA